MITQIEQYAHQYRIPIMEKEGIQFLQEFIIKNNIKTILEIGSAIGYSAIMMAQINADIVIDTIEKNFDRYQMAEQNIKSLNLDHQINIIHQNALDDIKLKRHYDLIFIDAAKSKSIAFFKKFEPYLNPNGYIITDNINFHGLTHNPELIKSKRTAKLVAKIKQYIAFLETNPEYETSFINIGDGLAISRKK